MFERSDGNVVEQKYLRIVTVSLGENYSDNVRVIYWLWCPSDNFTKGVSAVVLLAHTFNQLLFGRIYCRGRDASSQKEPQYEKLTQGK